MPVVVDNSIPVGTQVLGDFRTVDKWHGESFDPIYQQLLALKAEDPYLTGVEMSPSIEQALKDKYKVEEANLPPATTIWNVPYSVVWPFAASSMRFTYADGSTCWLEPDE